MSPTASDIDEALMHEARSRARFSTDRSRQVRCVIADDSGTILSEGWNTVPVGCAHTEARHQRPAKYLWTEHAERNAVYLAARRGVPLEGATIYVPWYPCFDCARAIVNTGIQRMVSYPPDFSDPHWGDQFREVFELFSEVGLKVDFLKGEPPQLADCTSADNTCEMET